MPAVKVPIHPGEILSEEFLKPAGITQERFAEALGVSRRTVNEIVRGRRSITAETALRLSKVLGTSAEMWMGLQADYDLLTAPKIAGLKRLKLSVA
jgi:addiction module HigA family antidote